jgi:small subunit ribosomal protein S8
MMTDAIADMLTRIRNANSAKKSSLSMPASKMRVRIAQVLQDEGYITGYRVVADKPSSRLEIDLKYGPDGERVIHRIDRVSKPGRRVYSGARRLTSVLRGMGITILSTPKGVLSDRAARRENVGGEVLCKVE